MRPRRKSPRRAQGGPRERPRGGTQGRAQGRAQGGEPRKHQRGGGLSLKRHALYFMDVIRLSHACRAQFVEITGVTPLARESPYKHKNHCRWLAPQKVTRKHNVTMLQVLRHRPSNELNGIFRHAGANRDLCMHVRVSFTRTKKSKIDMLKLAGRRPAIT